MDSRVAQRVCIFTLSSPILDLVPDLSLRWLFLDLNSYFASVEQELRPELRGRPIAVVPVRAETTCCIAVSYQARSYGVRTGVSVAQARELCPQIEFVEARPRTYVEMHHRIRAAIERYLPIHAVLSCDEFCCSLLGEQRGAPRAVGIASEVKGAIREVGSTLRCSIGLGPNRMLAKIAAGMQKPDGLMLIEQSHLPQALFGMALADIPGIGRRMELRLAKSGIRTIRQMCTLNRRQMAAIWGGVLGERMWLSLRGEDLPEVSPGVAQTISRQHILPPDQRSREGCRRVAFKMLHDCVRRLRKQDLWAGGLGVAVYYLGHNHVFEAHHPVAPCQDAITLQGHLVPLLDGAPKQAPASLCVFLTDVQAQRTGSLFPVEEQEQKARGAVSDAMDRIRQRHGSRAIYLASVHGALEAAPTRISFGPPPPLEEFNREQTSKLERPQR